MQSSGVHPAPAAGTDCGPEPGKLALQPRELKFDARLAPTEGRFAEATSARRGFRAPQKLHALGARGARLSPAPEPGLPTDEPIAHRLSHKTELRADAASPDAGPVAAGAGGPGKTLRNIFTVQTAAGSGGPVGDGQRPRHRRPDAHAPELRRNTTTSAVGVLAGPPKWARGTIRGATQRSLAPIPTSPRGRQRGQHLLVEGSAVLAGDGGQAAAALAHLSGCVAAERRLREQLEAARAERLHAYRAVVRVCIGASREPAEDSAPKPVMRNLTDTLAVARCSVVTNTLAATIQSYVRAQRSRQLTAALRRLRRAPRISAGGSSSHDAIMSLLSLDTEPLRRPSPDEALCTSPSVALNTTTTSLEDVLDTGEVARLKQLYFDYFDCEVVLLASLGESNAIENGFLPPSGSHGPRGITLSPDPSSTFSTTMTSSAGGDTYESASAFSSTM